jgi:hypothetical protein
MQCTSHLDTLDFNGGAAGLRHPDRRAGAVIINFAAKAGQLLLIGWSGRAERDHMAGKGRLFTNHRHGFYRKAGFDMVRGLGAELTAET